MNGYSNDAGYFGGGMGGGDQNDGTENLMMMGQDGMGTPMGGQSLDEIVNQNAKVMRRQSMPLPYSDQQNSMDGTDMRRISMMDYGQASPSVLGNLQYDSNNGMDQSGMMTGGATPSRDPGGQHPQSRRPSSGNLALNTSFSNTPANYNTMMHSNSAYASPAHPQSGFDMSLDNTYDSNVGMTVDSSIDQSTFGNASGNDVSQMNLYNQQRFNQTMMSSPLQHGGSVDTPLSARGPSLDSGGGSGMTTAHGNLGGSHNSGRHNAVRQLTRTHSLQMPDPSPTHSMGTPMSQPASAQNTSHAHSGFAPQPQHPQPGSHQDRGMHRNASEFDGVNGPQPVDMSQYNPNNQGFNWDQPEGGWPSTMIGRPHSHSTYKNAYSSTGFDMLGVLMRVATRPNPEINIGAVDLSCAFVVCDAEKDDFPIVYCSENFERLTGYTKHMILGRNCRFLQSPDGNVAPGVTRKYVDDNSVLYLKNMITLRREAQISLINYRRGGQPFMNLLTMIPITWSTDQVKFFVGFQVDLVEQPNAVTNKNPDGSYSINYQRGMTMPRYILNPPDVSQKTDLGQTIPRDDVSAILSTFGTGESDYAKRMWDKVLLENTDDVVHVLSLKGLFQWISPSAARVLEYEPSEIIGTALSSVCHPSDIVPVTRELKDTSSGASVNVVFRIRRKNSGYMWFEGHGSLHTEQGKGRKSIILVGRERPVYTLSKRDIVNAGGIGENELWTKMSTSGMFLYVSSNVRQLLDRQPDDLVGVSMQSLMRADSKAEFGRILEHARTGKKASVKHEMINRRGQVLSAFTTLYPGDATEGQKPTFIVAQTRLIKFTRTTPLPRPSIYPKQERQSSDQSLPSANLQIGNATTETTTDANWDSDTPNSARSTSAFVTTDGSAATYSGSNGLVIGRQDVSLASEDNLFDELKTTKSSSWQYEIRQLEKKNRMLVEEVQSLIAAKKKRKRRRGKDLQKDCANCHTRVTPEWRRGPSGQRDLCNSCGLRWAKLNGRVSPRASSQHSVHSAASDKASKASATSASPRHPSSGAGAGAGGMSSSNASKPLKTESPNDTRRSSSSPAHPQDGGGGGGGGNAAATTTTMNNHHHHHNNMVESHAASMEGASGVPDKIDEGIEPD